MKLLTTSSQITCTCLLFSTMACVTSSPTINPTIEKFKEAPLTKTPGVETLCEDWAVITDGIYKYENNVWGADKELPYHQCLVKKSENGKTSYGWNWTWQGKAPNWVFAYPEIIVGWKPWGESQPTHPAYPIKVSNIKNLKISYDVNLEAEGSYNLAPEIWLVSSKPKSFPIEKPEQLITTEIMFWMDYSADATPAGSRIGNFEFDGKEYDLWHKDNHNNSGDSVSWAIFSLVSKEKQLSASIDVSGLLKKLIELGYDIDENEYVATVEFGTEVLGKTANSQSRGAVWVNEYEVSLESH